MIQRCIQFKFLQASQNEGESNQGLIHDKYVLDDQYFNAQIYSSFHKNTV